MNSILVVDDEKIIRDSIKRLLEKNHYQVSVAESVEEAVLLAEQQVFDLVLSDLRLPGAPGTELITQFSDIPIIIMTSYASVSSAVESMKMGAVDYIAKPFDHTELIMLVKRTLKQRHLEKENLALRQEIARENPVNGMIGDCDLMQEVRKRIYKVAPTDTSVLILGETGTGKELVARAIHECSRRQTSPLISINCAAIAENLIESELFGYEKGAFTGADKNHAGLIEAADGGTLFLDEIGELPVEAQARLLRVLQEKEIRRLGSVKSRQVDIRLIAATHRDLQQMVAGHEFRSDLYYRLNVFEITVPPLRERKNDLPQLANALLDKISHQLAKSPISLSSDAAMVFANYNWPGNVRELENIIERAVILMDGNTLLPEHLPALEQPGKKAEPDMQNLSLDDYFIQFVQLNEHKMTEIELANQLGISRKTLWERRNRLGRLFHK